MSAGRGRRSVRWRRLRARLTYARVVSVLALVVSVATGGAYAASKIGADHIRAGAIRSKHIKDRTLAARDMARRTLATLRGPAGRAGPVGAAGPKGHKGETGPPGQAGAKGDPSFTADCNYGLHTGDVMVRVGPICIDRYEASIWDAPVGGRQIVGDEPSDYCDPGGQNCRNIYARSVAGVEPATNLTYFQAQAALANAGKRLASNAEWQTAVSGTPDMTGQDPGPCAGRRPTGAASGCASRFGARDMVGNVWEWVGEWLQLSINCPGWDPPEEDAMCLAGVSENNGPGSLIRGGAANDGAAAGPLAVRANWRPQDPSGQIGFRGVRR